MSISARIDIHLEEVEGSVVGDCVVEGVTYEFIYQEGKVHFDGGPKNGATYGMTHLVMEEKVSLEARLLARGILHHFKT